MSVRDKKNITLLNYCTNTVVVSTKDTSYCIPPSDGEIPTTLTLSFDEIQFINSNSPAFKDGTLRFEKDIEKEMYEELRIENWESILTNEQIKDTILNPTYEKLVKFVDTNSLSVISRIRGVFISLKNSGEYDVSTRVENIIDTRYKELLSGQVRTRITITQKDTRPVASKEDLNSLKAENAEMRNQIEEMKFMIQKMLDAQKPVPDENDNSTTMESKQPVKAAASKRVTTRAKTK